jgi:subtilisin family serine protease
MDRKMRKNAYKDSLIKVVFFAIFVIAAIGALNVSTSAINYENPSNANNRIDEYLRQILNEQSSNESIPVVIILREQPAQNISSKVKNEYKKQFDNITNPAKPIYSRIKPIIRSKKGKNISELVGLEQSLLTQKEKNILAGVGKNVESKTRQMRREILNQTTPEVEGIQAPLITKIIARGGSIKYSSKILNAIVADIPISYINELSQDQAVYKIYHDYVLNETLEISTQAMGANTWWSNNYTGSFMDAAVVDTGIDASHPALNVDYAGVFHSTGRYNSNYNDNPTNTDDFQGHGTHVAGIVASTDSTYRGVGYGIDKLINAKAGWRTKAGGGSMYWSDAMQAFDWSIFGNPDDADVISLSFGGGTTNGNSGFEHFLDAIVYDLDIQVVVANGNGGPGSSTVGEPAGAFNILAVGNVDDWNTISRDNDVLTPSSSRGPTLDGRIKPDISAPGMNIMSANNNWETGADFVSKSGTSMAAPHITGSVLLILDYKNFRWQPEAIKALLLNTAEDKGTPGPDNDYGFGYVNLSNTYIHRDDVTTGSIDDLPNGSVEKFYKGIANNGDRETLVWNRHVTYNGPIDPTSYLSISDLDLLMYNEANGATISASSSRLNNVEQVKSNGNFGSAILKINPYSTFPSGITLEDYALATDETFVNVTPPILNLKISNTESVNSGNNFTLNVTVNNSGDISVHNVNANITLPSGFNILSGANPQPLGSISSGGAKNASWVVKAPNNNPDTQYDIKAFASSNSYDEFYSKNSTNTIIVMADLMPPASITALMNVSYASNYINWTWMDPSDEDFSKVKIYINDVYQRDVLKAEQYYNATGLGYGTYTIGTRTVDNIGNINTSMITHTASTKLPILRFINGTVMDNVTNTGIAGVIVSANNTSTTTDASGFYSFIVMPGTYDITATFDPLYYSNNSIVTTESVAVVIQDIELPEKPTGNITGSVTK